MKQSIIPLLPILITLSIIIVVILLNTKKKRKNLAKKKCLQRRQRQNGYGIYIVSNYHNKSFLVIEISYVQYKALVIFGFRIGKKKSGIDLSYIIIPSLNLIFLSTNRKDDFFFLKKKKTKSVMKS